MKGRTITGSLLAVVLTALSVGPSTVAAQQTPDSIDARLVKVAAEAKTWPRLKGIPDDQRRDTLIFALGNVLYVVFHEMGHAVISEMKLPVVGREEDAADSFAIVTGLKMMTNVSERTLIEAGKGWFFSELSDRKSGYMAAFYERHGMNLQRAYQIVCFMVGANPDKFAKLAETTKLPASRQQTCKHDYAATAWSWEELLRPHRRKPDQAMTKIDIVYAREKAIWMFTPKHSRICSSSSASHIWRRTNLCGASVLHGNGELRQGQCLLEREGTQGLRVLRVDQLVCTVVPRIRGRSPSQSPDECDETADSRLTMRPGLSGSETAAT